MTNKGLSNPTIDFKSFSKKLHRISGVWETIIIGKFMKIASTKLSYFCHNSLMRTEDFFLRGTGSSYRKYCFNKDYFDCWPFHMNHLAFLKYEIWIFVYAKLIKNSALFLLVKLSPTLAPADYIVALPAIEVWRNLKNRQQQGNTMQNMLRLGPARHLTKIDVYTKLEVLSNWIWATNKCFALN